MPASRVAKLDFLAALDIRGADAAAFLHAQLCGDVLGIAPGKCRFTAWCNPKGRVIATVLLAHGSTGFRMYLQRDIAARVLQRLGMYVLRARVDLLDRREDLAVAGHYGAFAGTAPLPAAEHPWDFVEGDGLAVAVLPGSGGARWMLSGPAAATPAGTADAAAGWHLEDIVAGIPWIGLPLSDEFLPQELDLERLEGLSYTKGCFPGQEVIARVHSRGRLKRSLRRFAVPGEPPAPAARIVSADGAAAGTVIAAENSGPGSCTGLAVVDRERVAREPLHLEARAGALLRFDAPGQD